MQATKTDSSVGSGTKSSWRTKISSVPGQVWMTLGALSFATGNLYDQAATQDIQRPDSVVAAAVQSVPIFIYGLVMFLLFSRRQPTEATKVETVGVKQARRRGYLYFAIAGVITQIGTAAFFQALIVTKFQGLAVTLPFVQTWELMGIVMAAIFLREKPTWALYVGMAIVVIGLAGVSVAGSQNPATNDWYLAVPLGLLAAVCWAGASILARAGMKRGASPFAGLSVQYLAGGIGATLIVAAQGHLSLFAIASLNIWLYLLGGAVINGILATGFLTFALRVSPAYKVLPIDACYPALAVILGWLILGNSVSPFAFISVLIVAGGVIFTQVGPYIFKRGNASSKPNVVESPQS